jgi:hypothetical protein
VQYQQYYLQGTGAVHSSWTGNTSGVPGTTQGGNTQGLATHGSAPAPSGAAAGGYTAAASPGKLLTCLRTFTRCVTPLL